MLPAHRQAGHRIRLEWGATGAVAVAHGAGTVVVVDVLSFTTTLTLAVARGLEVLPFAWKDERAAAYAAEQGADLAVGRLEARHRPGLLSLSPAGMANADPDLAGNGRLVLPSPNGSTICALLAETGVEVVGGCLLNAGAVAGLLADRLTTGATLALIAAGEQWPDGSLRPAVEDLWGAGAVLAALVDRLPDADLSPEARVAEQAFRAVRIDLVSALAGCASGVELLAAGFSADPVAAAAHDSLDVVAVLGPGGFNPADSPPGGSAAQ